MTETEQIKPDNWEPGLLFTMRVRPAGPDLTIRIESSPIEKPWLIESCGEMRMTENEWTAFRSLMLKYFGGHRIEIDRPTDTTQTTILTDQRALEIPTPNTQYPTPDPEAPIA